MGSNENVFIVQQKEEFGVRGSGLGNLNLNTTNIAFFKPELPYLYRAFHPGRTREVEYWAQMEIH